MSDEQPMDEAIDPDLAPPEAALPPRTEPGVLPEDLDDEDQEEGSGDEEITELTDEERQQFNSLLTVGKRIKKVTVLDRPVIISSLTVDDVLRVGLKVQEYHGTQAFAQAYQAAMCAAAIKSVDGQSWENTLVMNPDPDVLFDEKWQKVSQFYPLVISYIYNEVISLDSEFSELATKLGKL